MRRVVGKGADAELVLTSIQTRLTALECRVRHLEKIEDTRNTVWWRRLLFRVDGWPRAGIVASERSWRPWHRWLPPS